MLTYVQSTGALTDAAGTLLGTGYSGRDVGKNNPDLASVEGVGPICCGRYTIQPPVDTDTHGPYLLRLVPDPTNLMYGRMGFAIHGDSIPNPGHASSGCVILSRPVRETIWDSGDHRLLVVSNPPPAVHSPSEVPCP